MRNIEYVLWGTPKGESDALHEKVLITQTGERKPGDRIETVKGLASVDGWHSFRVQTLNLDAVPDFAGTIQGMRKR